MNRQLISLIRPHQWLKNLFVFTPLFFDRHAGDWHYVLPCTLVFFAFCLAASGVYCLNDIQDAAADRQHPVKRTRPIACGSVSKQTGYVVMMVLWVGAFSLAALTYACCNKMQIGLICTLLFYIAMNVAYCVRLKHVALLDVFIVAIGFVLRIIAGGQVGGIALSHWIVITTFSLALFLAVAKRRDDMALYDASGIKTRKSLSGYNIDFLNLCIGILGCITIMCYILYTVSTEIIERIGNYHLYITSLFVLAAILRYIQLTLVEHKSGSPTKLLLRDHFIHVCIFGWILAFTFILYL